jgi:hypothetical protein
MVVGLRRIGKRILDHLRKNEAENLRAKAKPVSSERGMPGRGRGHSRGSYTFKTLYCMYHDSDTNHHTQDCPIFLESKRKMEQDSNQPPQHSLSREVNHTTHWPSSHNHYSPSYPSLFTPQTDRNNQAQAPAYYQSYHYTTTNHPQPSPNPQIAYPPPVPQITYPMPNNANQKSKPEANYWGPVSWVPWVTSYAPKFWIRSIPTSGKWQRNHMPRTRYGHTTPG